MNATDPLPTAAVKAYLMDLQDRICSALQEQDGRASFLEDSWTRDTDPEAAQGQVADHPALGGGGRTRVLRQGGVFEQAGVNFSHVGGRRSPVTWEKLTPPFSMTVPDSRTRVRPPPPAGRSQASWRKRAVPPAARSWASMAAQMRSCRSRR